MSAALVEDLDLVQIGPFGWVFHADDLLLSPARPIAGRSLHVRAAVENRLHPVELHVQAHQMVAVTGPSGCGKSTLLNEIKHQPEVFFMPQKDLVHPDLRVREQLMLMARSFGNDGLPCDIDDTLRSVGLGSNLGQRFPHELSGGQLKRVRLAGAILSGRGIVILDEPDSGLDHETAAGIVSLLRRLSLRGATVIVVTHHRHTTSYFDRILKLAATPSGGSLISDELTEETKRDLHTGNSELNPDQLTKNQSTSVGDARIIRHQPLLACQRELKKLISTRNSLRFASIRLPSCLLPLLWVPLFFAAAVSISVPTDPDLNVEDGLYGDSGPIQLLGFLSTVAVVWMAASHSHLSVARNRELYDYEHLLGTTRLSLMTGKSVVYTAAAVLQVSVYVAALYGIRHCLLGRSFFVTENWFVLPSVWFVLIILTCAATALGLLISTVAGRNPLVAAAILPVVMIVQVLFSVPIAVSDSDRYEPLDGPRQLSVYVGQSGSADAATDEHARPMRVAAVISALTLTYYADACLRSFSSQVTPVNGAFLYCVKSIGLLTTWTVIFYLISGLFFRKQSQRS